MIFLRNRSIMLRPAINPPAANSVSPVTTNTVAVTALSDALNDVNGIAKSAM
jgi:hypothetical protein